MLVSDVIRQVTRSFGDTDQVFLTNADFYDWINEAVYDICKKTLTLTKTATGVAASTFPANLATDLIQINRILYGTQPLKEVQLRDLDALSINTDTDTFTPSYFYVHNRQINLYPLQPSSDATLVYITYAYFPTAVAATATTIATPPIYDKDIVAYVLAKAHERNQNQAGYAQSMDRFQQSIGADGDIDYNKVDTYPIIRDDPYEDW